MGVKILWGSEKVQVRSFLGFFPSFSSELCPRAFELIKAKTLPSLSQFCPFLHTKARAASGAFSPPAKAGTRRCWQPATRGAWQSRIRRGGCARRVCAPSAGRTRRPEGAWRVCAPRTSRVRQRGVRAQDADGASRLRAPRSPGGRPAARPRTAGRLPPDWLAKVRGSASSRGRRVPGSPAPRRRNPGLGRALATQLSPPPPAAPPPSAASPAEAAAAGAERAPGVRDSAGRGCGLRQGWRLSLSIPGREVANGGDYRSSLRLRWCRSCPPLPRGTLRSGMRLAGLGAPRRWLPELPGGR
jgi:hypothetical protein